VPERRHLAAPPLALAAALLASSCSGEPTSLRLRISADSSLDTEGQVLAAIDRLELVLDARGGFAGVTGAGAAAGAFVAEDVDSDSELELVLDRDTAGLDTFPAYRLLPGSNAATRFSATAKGTSRSEVAAVGAAASLRFVDGESPEVQIPLNLRAKYRAPQVILTLPQNGQSSVPGALSQIYVLFSKAILSSSLAGNLRVVYSGTAGEKELQGAWTLSTTSVLDQGFEEDRTEATLKLAGCVLNPGTYRLEAGTGITDAAGTALDQSPPEEGQSGFEGTFTVSGTAAASPCSSSGGCKSDSDCNSATSTGTASKKYTCQIPGGASTGSCVVVPEKDCTDSSVACPPGYVCAPASSADSSVTCTSDCRVTGVCKAGTTCDQTSGLCKTAPSSDGAS
jgi:hypothetical protein